MPNFKPLPMEKRKDELMTPTRSTQSILMRPKKTPVVEAVDKVMSYLVEPDVTTAIPPIQFSTARAAETNTAVPDILLPKSNEGKINNLSLSQNNHSIPKTGELLDQLATFFSNITIPEFSMFGFILWKKQDIGKKWFPESIVTESEILFDNNQVSIWACRGLLKFVVQSTTEDRYAQVYQSVPDILQTLVRLHTAIENWIKLKQISTQPIGSLSDLTRIHHSRNLFSDLHILPLPYNLLLVVENCIYQIIGTYYSNLPRMKFDAKYTEQIQKFVDFSQ
ncbi:hypothetical protein BC833DRAFT_599464 [Globomyces pollinis-pini]|nr:hypothetical protein BC833DRAFT_599464 [Globomyces pollinis-pini]